MSLSPELTRMPADVQSDEEYPAFAVTKRSRSNEKTVF